MTRIVKITLLFFIVFAMTSSTCYKNKPVDEETFVYSNVEDIIYPPDEFQLLFNLRTFNNYEGIIVFKNNSVFFILVINFVWQNCLIFDGMRERLISTPSSEYGIVSF